MTRIISIGKRVLGNSVIKYILGRYGTYFIQFVNSIFIAILLGPYYLGLWGFITLVVQYFNLINFGIPLSLNALASVEKGDEEKVSDIFNTSNVMLIALFLIIGLLFLANTFLDLKIGDKYHFDEYAIIVFFIVGINNLLTNFFNIFRVYGKLVEIAFNQTAFPILMLVCILFFKGEHLLWSLVWSNLIAFVASFLLYIWKCPVKLKFKFKLKIAKDLQRKGWYLFVYNTCFYLILMSVRSVISTYYQVSEFGFFTFSFSLANVILLLFQSFATLIFPKVLNKLSKSSHEECYDFIQRIRNSYIGLSHLLVHFVILFFPIFLYFFPKYNSILPCFRLITLTLVLFTNSLGFQDLLIAKNRERLLSLISLITLLVNVGLAYLLVRLNVGYEFIILSTTVSMFGFSFYVSKIGLNILEKNKTFTKTLAEVFPLEILLPYILSIILLTIRASNFFYLLPCILFVVMNLKNLKSSVQVVKSIIENPQIINIK
jgi:O-antigen/teichoic acid export membrane protein